MRNDINSVVLTGRLARDPEIRYTPDNKKVARITIAVNRSYYFKNEFKNEVFFIDIKALGSLADEIQNNFSKGLKVAAEGKLQISYYETSSGDKKKIIELIANQLELLSVKEDFLVAKEESVLGE